MGILHRDLIKLEKDLSEPEVFLFVFHGLYDYKARIDRPENHLMKVLRMIKSVTFRQLHFPTTSVKLYVKYV